MGTERELRVYFRSFVAQISINRKLRSNMSGKVTELGVHFSHFQTSQIALPLV